MSRGEPSFNLTQGLPIIDNDGKLVGVVTQGDLLRALEADPKGTTTVLEAGSRNLAVAYPDESAFDALFRMLQNNIGRLPVVSREDPKQMVGYLNRSSILGAWTRQMEDEARARAWLGKEVAYGAGGGACQTKLRVWRHADSGVLDFDSCMGSVALLAVCYEKTGHYFLFSCPNHHTKIPPNRTAGIQNSMKFIAMASLIVSSIGNWCAR